MAIKVVDGGQVHGDFDQLLKSFMPFAKKRLGYDKPVDVQLVSDPENAKDPLGKTAYYDPNLMRITVFVDKRHVKDILRSLSHELVHHKQNCEGKLANMHAEEGYAQNNPHLRKLEGEAYLEGSGYMLRDWEDKKKKESKLIQGEGKMNEDSLQETVQKVVKFIKEEMPQLSLAGAEAPGGAMARLREALNQDDNIPPDIVEIILEKVQSVMGGQINEGEDSHATWCVKATWDGGESSKNVHVDADLAVGTQRGRARKMWSTSEQGKATLRKKGARVTSVTAGGCSQSEAKSINEDWARAGKDKRIFEELMKRWCK